MNINSFRKGHSGTNPDKHKGVKILLSCLLCAISVSAQLKINELMPRNVSAVMDESYNYSMWVEVYNSSESSSYNISNYYFSDDRTQTKKWKPLSKTITAKGFHVIWFERDDRSGHASFKLEPNGGKLYLFNASSQLVDSVIYPPQMRNISYGRKTDGGNEWVFFEQFSSGTSNTGKLWKEIRCPNPVFSKTGGFYNASTGVTFTAPAENDTIYYSLDGSEPKRGTSIRYVPGSSIWLTKTSVIRARTVSGLKHASDIISHTYLIRERDFNLPVVSIITEQANLTDNLIGIYVRGTNGIAGNGTDQPANWNQDWDRPVNFELIDTTNTVRLNQELDVRIAGGWSRTLNGQKSLIINPKHKFGNNNLEYDIFAATKPNQKYKSVMLRNSGNDFGCSMLRDAYMTSLVMKRMNLDYQAYEPAVCFMNGVYYGIQNLRERSNEDLLYSSYGLKEENIHLIEAENLPVDAEYLKLVNYATTNDLKTQSAYDNISQMMDIDNFISYFVSEIYFANTDWPHNNMKAWKTMPDGKWRWILHDTDFGYGLNNAYTHNTLSHVLDYGATGAIDKFTVTRKVLNALLLNETFKNKFIDKFSVQISSTFEPVRANHILDSLASKIAVEIPYHKAKWGSSRDFNSDINTMKTFSERRPDAMLGFVSNKLLKGAAIRTIQLKSDNPNATFRFNEEKIIDPQINLKSFSGRSFTLEANPVPGYKFLKWEYTGANSETLIPYGSDWKYNDGNSAPVGDWITSNFNELSWKSGKAQLGYGNKGEVTTIGYGGNANNKYTTSYYRKTFSITNLDKKDNFSLTVFVDDGAAVYVNGTEVGRTNMPSGILSYSTFATIYNNGVYGTFNIPKNLLKEGNNLVAVEVHQCDLVSSDVIFDLELRCSIPTESQTLTNPVYVGTLLADISLKAVYEKTDEIIPEEVVFINEIVSSNNLITDEYGEKDDYIELYNSSDTDINIAGWYISDKPANPTLYQFPATDSIKTLIPAKGFLVIWADTQPEQGVLHAGFNISKDGETITLSRRNQSGELSVIDQVICPVLNQNMSYSRLPDGSDHWIIQGFTLNKPNASYTSDKPVVRDLKSSFMMNREELTITNAKGETLSVIDLTGKIRMKKYISSDDEKIELGFLANGIYIVRVGTEIFKITRL